MPKPEIRLLEDPQNNEKHHGYKKQLLMLFFFFFSPPFLWLFSLFFWLSNEKFKKDVIPHSTKKLPLTNRG